MAKIRSLGAAVEQAMLDDQKATMTITPLDANGQNSAIPTGAAVPTYAASPGTAVTLDPTVDPTGLSCLVKGVKGLAGDEVVTASFTNADGTVATGTATFHQTIDPAELDVASLGVSVSTPVAQ